jgi:hypothetical protein
MYDVPTKMMTKSNTWYVILIVFEGYASGVQLHEQYHYTTNIHYASRKVVACRAYKRCRGAQVLRAGAVAALKLSAEAARKRVRSQGSARFRSFRTYSL